MGKISFDAYQQYQEKRDEAANTPYIGYFSLKDDGDEAVVRIMHDSTDDFDMCVIHEVPQPNTARTKKVSCIRLAGQPFDTCPLCNAGVKVSSRIYIHLLVYTKDEAGRVVVTPKIWERSAQHAAALRDYIVDYGPLSEQIFKIKRCGKRGSQDTTYNIIYGRPEVFRPEAYPIDREVFKNYSAVGTAVADESYEKLATYAADLDKIQEPPAYAPGNTSYEPVPKATAPESSLLSAAQTVVAQSSAPADTTPPWQTAPRQPAFGETSNAARPIRRY